MGENIADLGGVNIAFDALQMYLKDKGNPGKISGFDQNQRFFLKLGNSLENQRNGEILHQPSENRFAFSRNVQSIWSAGKHRSLV